MSRLNEPVSAILIYKGEEFQVKLDFSVLEPWSHINGDKITFPNPLRIKLDESNISFPKLEETLSSSQTSFIEKPESNNISSKALPIEAKEREMARSSSLSENELEKLFPRPSNDARLLISTTIKHKSDIPPELDLFSKVLSPKYKYYIHGINLWRLSDKTKITNLYLKEEDIIKIQIFNQDLVLYETNNTCQLWSLKDNKLLTVIMLSGSKFGEYKMLNENLFLCFSENRLAIYDIKERHVRLYMDNIARIPFKGVKLFPEVSETFPAGLLVIERPGCLDVRDANTLKVVLDLFNSFPSSYTYQIFNAKYLAAIIGSVNLKVWNIETKELIHSSTLSCLPGHSVKPFVFSNNPSRALFNTEVWDLDNNKKVFSIDPEGKYPPSSMELLPYNRLLIVSLNRIRIFDLDIGVFSLDFENITSGDFRKVNICECSFLSEKYIYYLPFFSNARLLNIVNKTSSIPKWNIGEEPIFLPGDRAAIVNGNLSCLVEIWNYETETLVTSLNCFTTITKVDYKEEYGNYLIVQTYLDDQIRVWDLTNYECILSLKAYLTSTSEVKFLEDNLISISSGGCFDLWDLKERKEIFSVEQPFGTNYRVLEDGKVLAERGNFVKIWDYKKKILILDTCTDFCSVETIKITEDRSVVLGSSDHFLYSLKIGEPLNSAAGRIF